ncbi:hypothetical protein [Botryobacter ruber]|uniref:hypothetical protein n=1 Tax=Botryobacter ruber TaxID=2171629 RepID=UPI000E0A2245|nr:hypothetical protein [Botryobacter ruber]
MENKSKAVQEMFGCKLEEDLCSRLYNDTYGYILYNDTQSFLELLDYSMSLKDLNVTPSEDFLVFKYMLRLMLKKHPKKLLMLLPASANNSIKKRINSKICTFSQQQR